MPRPCYSTIFEQSAGRVWSVIRDFSSYGWAGAVSECHIEDGKSGDAVGCIRNVRTRDRTIRQKLLAHSDQDRFYTYALCEPVPFPLRDYVATIRVTPVTDGARSFVEWRATFDCADNEREHWTGHFTSSFSRWLEALRCALVT
jgi:Polyketide cyclase / dehydrase and lipid transport